MQILAEDRNFLIVEKPSGVSSHPSPGDPAEDLITLLASYGELGVITRLDRQASGLVLLSRDPYFTRNVEIIEKKYQAIVLGEAPEQGEIDNPLLIKKFNDHQNKQLKSAQTYYFRQEYFGGCSLLEVNIRTGRHHQIRRHLRSIGHPILGDFRHGYADRNKIIQEQYGQPIRLYLHCAKLQFEFKKREYIFESKLPEDMQAMRSWLKTSAR